MSDKPIVSLGDLAGLFPDYDLDLIVARIDQIEPPQRFSQRAEAISLQPLIACLIQAKPYLTPAEIARILKEGARVNADKLGPTFEREIGSQVRAAKAGTHRSKSGSDKSRRMKPTPMNWAQNVGNASSAPSVRRATSSVDNTASPPPPAPVPIMASASASASASTSVSAMAKSGDVGGHRPYRYAGKFAGIVFKHTAPLRLFYGAIERHAEMSEIFKLANAAQADPASLAALAQLEPADRAIFESVIDATSGSSL